MIDVETPILHSCKDLPVSLSKSCCFFQLVIASVDQGVYSFIRSCTHSFMLLCTYTHEHIFVFVVYVHISSDPRLTSVTWSWAKV